MDQEVASLKSRIGGLELLVSQLEGRLDEAEQSYALLVSMNVEFLATLELLTERILGDDMGSEKAQQFMQAQNRMRLQIWETIAAAHPEAVNDMDPTARSAMENLVRGSNASPSSQ